jgi:hypothetical protein
VPTALERAGDFSQSLDNQGNPIPQLRSPVTGQPYPGNVIPANRPAVRARHGDAAIVPDAESQQQAPNSYNYEIPRPVDKNLLQQPAVRVDYQFSPAPARHGQVLGPAPARARPAGHMPGFNDVCTPWPYITNYGVTVNYTLNPTTFLEGTYGSIKNELAGGGSGGLLVSPAANRLTNLADLPLIYPDAGRGRSALLPDGR